MHTVSRDMTNDLQLLKSDTFEKENQPCFILHPDISKVYRFQWSVHVINERHFESGKHSTCENIIRRNKHTSVNEIYSFIHPFSVRYF